MGERCSREALHPSPRLCAQVREAAAELRLFVRQAMGGGGAAADEADALGSEAHVASLAGGLSGGAARAATADLVLHVCDLRAHLRAAQVQHAASEQALRNVLQVRHG